MNIAPATDHEILHHSHYGLSGPVAGDNQQRILCASCGTAIPPNAANMCLNCIRSDVDISQGIPKQATIHFCKGCDRYLSPPNIWITAELESRELLGLCLKKLKCNIKFCLRSDKRIAYPERY